MSLGAVRHRPSLAAGDGGGRNLIAFVAAANKKQIILLLPGKGHITIGLAEIGIQRLAVREEQRALALVGQGKRQGGITVSLTRDAERALPHRLTTVLGAG